MMPCVLKPLSASAQLLPVNHPFALQKWLVVMEFGCGDEDDHGVGTRWPLKVSSNPNSSVLYI